MCGVAGAIGFIDERIHRAVTAMHAAQAHRGPDGQGTWHSPPAPDGLGAILAHRRLSIIDLSAAGTQPMVDGERGNVICFNGEIYNYRELRAELTAKGVQCQSESDTEVLLRAYGAWGADCIPRLRGMFAFAIWDPARRSMLLARDRLGIKPLYAFEYRHPNGERTLLFASELRSLLASECVDRRLDPQALASYVWNGFVNGDRAIVRGVDLLPAASFAQPSVADPALAPRYYWHLPRASGARDDVAGVRGVLREATALHLVSDVPLGVFLSGGIDSSAVAALAAEAVGDSLRTYTITFDESEYDESQHARAVASALGAKHAEVRLGEDTFRRNLDAALDSIDQPTFDAINTYFVSRAVREAGITVALAGTGGDELFGGYTTFSDLPRARMASRAAALAPHACTRLLDLASRLRPGAPGGVPPQTRWGKLRDVLTSGGDLIELYQTSYALYTREFASELLLSAPSDAHWAGISPARASWLAQQIEGAQGLHAISTLELLNFIGQRLLRDTDAASMAVGLEVRVPLLDHKLVEECTTLGARRRFVPLQRKQALRDAGLERLDPRIFDRPKSGFVLPIEQWCRKGLQSRVAEVLHDRKTCADVGLNADALARLWTAFSAGAPGLYWSRVWAPFILLDWCAKHRVQL